MTTYTREKKTTIFYIFYGIVVQQISNFIKDVGYVLFYFMAYRTILLKKYLLLINLFSFLNFLIVFEFVALRRKIIG